MKRRDLTLTDFDLPIRIQKNIVALDVAVDYVSRVQVVQSSTNLKQQNVRSLVSSAKQRKLRISVTPPLTHPLTNRCDLTLVQLDIPIHNNLSQSPAFHILHYDSQFFFSNRSIFTRQEGFYIANYVWMNGLTEKDDFGKEEGEDSAWLGRE